MHGFLKLRMAPMQDLKLRMLNRGFNRPPGTGCLVFGDLDEGTRTDLLTASSGSGSDWLHIFAPAAAVESVSVRTPKEEFCLNSSFDGVATGAEASAIGAGPLPLLLAAPWPSAAAASPPNGAAAQPPAVLHLLVHKSARVAWRHMANDTYELSISSPDTTKDLMRKVEDATGLSLRDGQNQLVYGEQVRTGGMAAVCVRAPACSTYDSWEQITCVALLPPPTHTAPRSLDTKRGLHAAKSQCSCPQRLRPLGR